MLGQVDVDAGGVCGSPAVVKGISGDGDVCVGRVLEVFLQGHAPAHVRDRVVFYRNVVGVAGVARGDVDAGIGRKTAAGGNRVSGNHGILNTDQHNPALEELAGRGTGHGDVVVQKLHVERVEFGRSAAEVVRNNGVGVVDDRVALDQRAVEMPA